MPFNPRKGPSGPPFELDTDTVQNATDLPGETLSDTLDDLAGAVPAGSVPAAPAGVPGSPDDPGFVSFRLYANASSPLVGTTFWGTTVLAATTLSTSRDLGAGNRFQVVTWSSGASGANGRFRPAADLTSQAGPGAGGGGARKERWFTRKALIDAMPIPMTIAPRTAPPSNPLNPSSSVSLIIGNPGLPTSFGGLMRCAASGPGGATGGTNNTGGGGAGTGTGDATQAPVAGGTGNGGSQPLPNVSRSKGFGGCGANGSTSSATGAGRGGDANDGGGAGGGYGGTDGGVNQATDGGDTFDDGGGAGGGGGAGVGSGNQAFNGAAGGDAGDASGGSGGIGSSAGNPTDGQDGENGTFLQSGAGGGGGGSAGTEGFQGGEGGDGGIPAGGGGSGGNGKGTAGAQAGGPAGVGAEGLIAIVGYI